MAGIVRWSAVALLAAALSATGLPAGVRAQSIVVQTRSVTYAYQGQTYPGNAFVNGTSVVPAALYAEGTTYVPIRLVAQMLSLSVAWKSPDVEIGRAGTAMAPITTQASLPSRLQVQVVAAHIVIDGSDVTPSGGLFDNGQSSVPLALYYGGTTYVPLRFVDTALGLATAWDGATRTITISQAAGQGGAAPVAAGSIDLPTMTLSAGSTLEATIPTASTSVSWWLSDASGFLYPIFGATTSAVNTPLADNILPGSYTLYAQDNGAASPLLYSAKVQVTSNWSLLVDPADGHSVIDPFYVYNWEDMTPLFQYGYMGQGETIAIFDESDLQASDLSQFDAAYGLPQPNLSTVAPYGDPGVQTVPQPFASPLDETTLDVEWAHAMAPYAHIVLYLYPSSAQPHDLAAAVADAAANGDVAFSSSFGWVGDASTATESQIEASLSSGKIAVFASTGDHGTSNPVLAWPATSPSVVAVGGTEIQGAFGQNPTESYWNQGNDSTGVLWAGGYGYSDYPMPAWQQPVRTGSDRYLPDVSFLARDALVYENASWTADGGTSLAAPCWAAIWSLVAQYGAAQSAATPGLAMPAPQAIYDVASADAARFAKTPAFFPLPNQAAFDPQIGFGVPDVANLALDIASLP